MINKDELEKLKNAYHSAHSDYIDTVRVTNAAWETASDAWDAYQVARSDDNYDSDNKYNDCESMFNAAKTINGLLKR